jgi:hypothetical protein
MNLRQVVQTFILASALISLQACLVTTDTDPSNSQTALQERLDKINAMPYFYNTAAYLGTPKTISQSYYTCDSTDISRCSRPDSLSKYVQFYYLNGALERNIDYNPNGSKRWEVVFQWNGRRPSKEIRTEITDTGSTISTKTYNWIDSQTVQFYSYKESYTYKFSGTTSYSGYGKDSLNRTDWTESRDSLGLWLGGTSFDSTGTAKGWSTVRKFTRDSLGRPISGTGYSGSDCSQKSPSKSCSALKIDFLSPDPMGNAQIMNFTLNGLDSLGNPRVVHFIYQFEFTYW